MQKENNINSGKVVPLKEKISYGLGDLGNNFLFDMGQLYLLKFYTDSLGLSSGVAGLVFLVTKIWDAFADISIGTWVDNRKKIGKKGRFRPFMLYSAIPLALLTVVSFTTPNFSLTGKTIWAFATYMAFGTVYTIFNIPYGSMVPAMTRNIIERTDLASWRVAGANTGLLFTMMFFMPIVYAFESMQTGYLVATAVFASAGLVVMFMCYANVKERYVVTKPKTEKGEILKAYKSLFKNTPLLVLCVVNLFTFSAFNVKLGVTAFYCENLLNRTDIFPFVGLFSVGCIFLGVVLVPFLVRRYGKKATYILGAVIWAVGDLLAWFFATTPVSFISLACLAFFGSSLINTLNWALISDAVEYGEWKTGIRSEGLVYSSFTFFRKMAQAVAGGLSGFLLGWFGYVSKKQIVGNAQEIVNNTQTQPKLEQLQTMLGQTQEIVEQTVAIVTQPSSVVEQLQEIANQTQVVVEQTQVLEPTQLVEYIQQIVGQIQMLVKDPETVFQQTQRALDGLKILMFIYPGVLAIATIIVMYFCYKLTDTKAKEIIVELDARKN